MQAGILKVITLSIGTVRQIDSKTNADGGATVIKLELSENILNGTEALVINFQFTGWSQAENTDMYYKLAIEDII